MAETFARAVAPELSCPVCLELFIAPHIPKDLPECGHICCEVCLRNLVRGDNQFNCPECRTNINIPDGELSQLRTNLKVRNLAERYPKKLCEVPKNGEPICVEHDDAKMRYYCAPCNMLACQACILLKHKGEGHLSEKVEERYNKIHFQTVECQEVVDECNETLSTLDDLKSAIATKLEIQKEEVDVHVKDHVKKVKAAGKQLKEQLEATTTLILKEIDRRIIDHKEHIKSVEKLKEDAAKSAGSMPEADYILRHSAFPQKMETLREENAKFAMNDSAVSVEYKLLHDDDKPLCVGNIDQITPAVQIIGNFSKAFKAKKIYV